MIKNPKNTKKINLDDYSGKMLKHRGRFHDSVNKEIKTIFVVKNEVVSAEVDDDSEWLGVWGIKIVDFHEVRWVSSITFGKSWLVRRE